MFEKSANAIVGIENGVPNRNTIANVFHYANLYLNARFHRGILIEKRKPKLSPQIQIGPRTVNRIQSCVCTSNKKAKPTPQETCGSDWRPFDIIAHQLKNSARNKTTSRGD